MNSPAPTTLPDEDVPSGLKSDAAPASAREWPRTRTITIIEPRHGWRALELDALWRCRSLLWMFIWRDIKATQKQTILGFVWIVISPLISVAAMSIVFGQMLSIPSDGVAYPIFLFAGQFLWGQFSQSCTSATASIVANAGFIQKVYIPRLIYPLSSSLAALPNIIVVFPIIIFAIVAIGQPLPWTAIFCPLIIGLVLATGLGIGLWLAPLNVFYRDVGRIANYLILVVFYLTPVIYPASLIPVRLRWLIAVNPMAGYITSLRACLFGTAFEPIALVVSVIFTLFVLISGAYFFTRLQDRFADVV